MEAFLFELTSGWLDPSEVTAFITVVFINVVLSGDNAIVVGMAAAGLPPSQRKKCIFWGIVAATVMRLVLAVVAAKLLAITGILLIGGVLLTWVCWKFWRELRSAHAEHDAEGAEAPPKTFRAAVMQILIADLSMSLDNVLAVVGAARDHLGVMVIGLALSVLLMGVAAGIVAALLNRYRWIAYAGLAILVYVAAKMLYEGAEDVAHALHWI
jgi:YjbE family integral membrane protein